MTVKVSKYCNSGVQWVKLFFHTGWYTTDSHILHILHTFKQRQRAPENTFYKNATTSFQWLLPSTAFSRELASKFKIHIGKAVNAKIYSETDFKWTFILTKSRQDRANPHNLVKICLSGLCPSLKISIFNILIQDSIVKQSVLNRKTQLLDQYSAAVF